MNRLRRHFHRSWAQLSRSSDAGSALVLALIVVLVVGSLLAAVMDFTRAGLTIVPGERNDRNTNNYVQGAVQGAIDNIRRSSELGRSDVADCPNFTPQEPKPDLPGVKDSEFVVQCEGAETGSTVGLDQPRFAIHALGVAPEGIRQINGNGLLTVNGGVYSSGVVAVAGGSSNGFHVKGTLRARSCSGNVSASDLVRSTCELGSAATPFDVAPDYDPAIADDTALKAIIDVSDVKKGADPVPECAANKVEFEPGYYSEKPSTLVNRLIPGCSVKNVYHFKPGVYYFDYAGDPWDIGATKVIGGTYVSNDLGAACDFADDASPAPGVQMIFGGSSRMFSAASAASGDGIEICGPEKGHTLGGAPQRIAVYALSSRNDLVDPPVTPALSRFAYTSGPTTSGSLPLSEDVAFTAPTLARTIEGGAAPPSAVATLVSNSQSARLDYGVLPAGPDKGSTVSAVAVHVAQNLTGPKSKLVLTLPDSALDADTAADVVEVDATNCPGNRCDITAVLSSRDITWRSLSQLSLAYVAHQNSGVASVDGVELEVTYRAPALRAMSCTTPPCVLLESTNNPNVFFHGTVYAPTAAMKVRIHNIGETIFDRGVVVRDLQLDMNASSTQTSAPFRLPGGTPDGRLVLFRGFVDGIEKVRACVRYIDKAPMPDGSMSAYPGWSLTVPRWLVQRTPSATTASCAGAPSA